MKFYIAIRSCGIDKPKGRENCFISTFRKSVETSTSGFWKALDTYWYFEQTITSNSGILKPLTTRSALELYIVNLFYTFPILDTLRMISIEAYHVLIGRFYNKLKHFTNSQNVVFIRSGNVHIILLFLLFSFLYLPILLHAFFALFTLVTIGVIYVNTVR